ncbi:hypothetical protein N9C44_01830 [bacterium]|nr:hypothetical protein [bacterium]|tara:strand:- start:2349 stop:3500 length:1152 start_codon:yes stop_codon:yes gene_type:complete
MEFLKFLGKNAKSKFYARDFRNNYRFRPDVNPPRIKFEGYVNFVFNRDLASFLGMENNTYKTNISSLVRRAQLPTVNFKNITKNQYNKKRIVSTGVEFAPVEITVFDTLNNEWLQLLMRYFSYLYMNPRNKNDVGDRDVHMNTPAGLENNSEFGGTSFKSGEAGLNLQRDKQFFERIDIIMYHGGKGVQYSLTGPLLNSFSMGDMDYSSNEFVEFTMNIEYENFTTFDIANFDLGAVDLDRFEKVNGLDFASDEVMIKPLGILGSGSEMEFLGQHDNNYGTRGRTVQPQLDPIQYDTNTGDVITTGKKEDTTAKASTYDAIDNPFSLDPSKNILKGLLNTAVLSKLTGNDVSDSVKNYTLTAITRAATDKMADVQDAPERGDS